MKIMNDDLIVRLSLICTLSFTFWLTFVNKVWLGGGKDKPTVSFFYSAKRLSFNPKETEGGRKQDAACLRPLPVQ